jgi:ABC-type xylose transport system permease subunit
MSIRTKFWLFGRDADHFGSYLAAHVVITVAACVLLWNYPDLAYTIGSWVAWIGGITAWAFVYRYAKENWTETEAGRHLMAFTAGLAMIFTWVVARNFFEVPSHVDTIVRLLIFSFITIHLIWRYRILRRQTRGNRDITEAVTQLHARDE